MKTKTIEVVYYNHGSRFTEVMTINEARRQLKESGRPNVDSLSDEQVAAAIKNDYLCIPC